MGTDQAMLRIGTWNTQWAEPGNPVGNAVRRDLAGPKCDILCVTEGCENLVPDNRNILDAGPERSSDISAERRKVLLWSKQPWCNVDEIRCEEHLKGRFVAGITQTPLGPLTVIGVCIPYRFSRQKVGHKQWKDHEAWLREFERLPHRQFTERTVILGDFNQRIPRKWQPQQVYASLLHAFEGFLIPTAGDVAGVPSLVIDHIAHTPDMALVGDIGLWPIRVVDNKPISDHIGVWGDFVLS
ncbi:MAG: hypothetical protein OXP75_19775 [Rhodospirillales bacterium]|nr:hypothetical protein [Rhodospirillales bacterium]